MGMKYSFAKYCQLREGLGFGLEPVEDAAVTKVLMWVGHGAAPEEVAQKMQYLQSPKGLNWIAKLVGGPSHDSGDAVHRVLQAVMQELGGA
jgi:hypothetical protein